jgi:hypothetical protein
MNGVNDARLRAAATDVALQELSDFVRTGIRIISQQADAAHDHAGRAVGTLERAGIDERLLHGMQTAVPFQSLNRGDWLSNCEADGNLARASRLATNQNGAGAALPFSAAIFAAGETKLVAQDVKERSIRGVMDRIPLAVHFDFECVRHAGSSEGDAIIVRQIPFHLKYPRKKAEVSNTKHCVHSNRLLPEPGSDGAETRKGFQSETEFTQSWITSLTREAERANNQL